MCCFTGPVLSVNATRIFARGEDGDRQWLAYHMQVEAPAELAMVLPLPVPPDSPDDALSFVDLKDMPDLFPKLDGLFPPVMTRTPLAGGAVPASIPEPLPVIEVGDFVASFVPQVANFTRLDPRFRLAGDIWDKLPAYRDWGFAVFALKPGKRSLHPMVFSFPTRVPGRLFFPTVHIHDGEVHAKARFDHRLYAQPRAGEQLVLTGWQESAGVPVTLIIGTPPPKPGTVDIAPTKGLLLADQHIYRRDLIGDQLNTDTWVARF